MSLTNDQKNEFNKLIEHRNNIVNDLTQIENILKKYFSEEFETSYQHWIPQIITALYEDKRWLPRGQHTMQQTIKRILDKSADFMDKGV